MEEDVSALPERCPPERPVLPQRVYEDDITWWNRDEEPEPPKPEHNRWAITFYYCKTLDSRVINSEDLPDHLPSFNYHHYCVSFNIDQEEAFEKLMEDDIQYDEEGEPITGTSSVSDPGISYLFGEVRTTFPKYDPKFLPILTFPPYEDDIGHYFPDGFQEAIMIHEDQIKSRAFGPCRIVHWEG